jgi:hypothetical protein
MRLFVKITPLRAGTGERAADPEIVPCPPDVERDMIRSFLVQRLASGFRR